MYSSVKGKPNNSDEIITFLSSLQVQVIQHAKQLPLRGNGVQEARAECELIMEHLQKLLDQARLHTGKRKNKVIQESWSVVLRIGKKLLLFARYQGKEELREHLKVFLKSGYR